MRLLSTLGAGLGEVFEHAPAGYDCCSVGPLAGHGYLAWASFLLDVLRRANSVGFSRTTDGGACWPLFVPIDQPGPFAGDDAPRILVLPAARCWLSSRKNGPTEIFFAWIRAG